MVEELIGASFLFKDWKERNADFSDGYDALGFFLLRKVKVAIHFCYQNLISSPNTLRQQGVCILRGLKKKTAPKSILQAVPG